MTQSDCGHRGKRILAKAGALAVALVLLSTGAAFATYTLDYAAGPGGSIAGSATQVVGYGGQQIEGFENLSDWTVEAYCTGAVTADTLHVLHGSGSLELTGGGGSDCATVARKTVSLDLASPAPMRLYFYVAEDPAPWIVVQFLTADRSKSMWCQIPPNQVRRGWNCATLLDSDWVSFGWCDLGHAVGRDGGCRWRAGDPSCQPRFPADSVQHSGTEGGSHVR